MHCFFAPRSASGISVHRVSPPNVAYRWHRVPGNQVAMDGVVLGDLRNQPGQDRSVGTGSQTPSGRELPNGMAGAPQTDASHDAA